MVKPRTFVNDTEPSTFSMRNTGVLEGSLMRRSSEKAQATSIIVKTQKRANLFLVITRMRAVFVRRGTKAFMVPTVSKLN